MKKQNKKGATPDGTIDEDTIAEIKCPPNSTISDGVDQKKTKYLAKQSGQLSLKRKETYFYQVQGQLAITQRKFCLFIVWITKDLYVQRVKN